MLDIAQTPVAKEIKLELYDRRRGRAIREESAALERVDLAKFVGFVFPNAKIEHLGRKSMLGLHRYRNAPSSLFFQAVHRAYSGHHALGLRPEVLMYLVNAVVAETVKRHPEDYRNLFTSQPGKVDIHVRHDSLKPGDPNSPWDEAIDLFDAALRPHIPSRVMAQMLPGFTTATNESIVASLVSFMDAASPYYDYHTHTMCGIPRVVLFGEAKDYRALAIAASELSKSFAKHLSDYFKNLVPVLDTIAKTAEGGQVDEDFWSSIYKHHDGSGTSMFNGWISSFLWYVHETDGYKDTTNPLVVKDKEAWDWTKMRDGSGWGSPGIASNSEPTHVSRVPFTWHYFGKVLPMSFIGGILGVDEAQGAITPNLSYGVLHA